MEQVYALIKHENIIETDSVQIVKASKNCETLVREFNNIYSELSKKYIVLEEAEGHATFTDNNKEFLIELFIEKIKLT